MERGPVKDYLKRIYDANLRDFGFLSDDKLLCLTIYAEARGEPREGKIAVGSVILERVDHRNWDGKNIKEVWRLGPQDGGKIIQTRTKLINGSGKIIIEKSVMLLLGNLEKLT